ncbi:MAG: DegV family protein [Sciscionella sp.]
MTMPVAVVTDSTASIPEDIAARWGVSVIGMQLRIGAILDEERQVSSEKLASAMNANVPVSTAPPDPAAFFWTYSDAVARGAKAIVSMHLSGRLSKTVNAAQQAATGLRVPVYVIDSGMVGMSLGFAVLSAARVAAAGGGAARVLAAAKRRCELGTELIYVNTLEFLRRGGRIGGASALLGTALSIKPVLTVQGGEVVPLDRARGTKRALRKMVDAAVRQADGQRVDVAIEYFESEENADDVRGKLELELPSVNEVLVTRVSAILGAHVGPGAVGIAVSPL